eukprot:CAMPEP_0205887300 /NCGR_PEP_ID=MMETSP1083-20121108/19738_1 /ASSEMBLY_ACC=CAM_ASM_000430 /TAXON_ID=97485 /ORGANISM="Prymnesium parvum, Strain Texoma1" /LENGTH=222 /DNA_ID=CAMNT_0053251079 /DNA_START=1199 /DNA_END=1865 /DNA_ORIENTATION=+
MARVLSVSLCSKTEPEIGCSSSKRAALGTLTPPWNKYRSEGFGDLGMAKSLGLSSRWAHSSKKLDPKSGGERTSSAAGERATIMLVDMERRLAARRAALLTASLGSLEENIMPRAPTWLSAPVGLAAPFEKGWKQLCDAMYTVLQPVLGEACTDLVRALRFSLAVDHISRTAHGPRHEKGHRQFHGAPKVGLQLGEWGDCKKAASEGKSRDESRTELEAGPP